MTAQLIPNLDDQRIAEQLALAKQLREQGMTGTGNSGMAGQVYMVGNQYGNLAKSLGGAFAQYMGNQNRQALDAQRQQQYSDYMKQLPSATTTQHYDPVNNPGTGPLADGMEVAKPTRQFQQERNDWALNAPDIPQFGALRQAGMAQALATPERQAAAEEAAANRKVQLQLTAEARAEEAERMRQWREEQAARDAAARQDNIRLAASLRPPPAAPAPHTAIAYDKEGNGILVDMRTGKELPLESVGKLPAGGGKGGQLPIQAQRMQSALQNLESGLGAYEKLLKQYNPRNADAVTPEKRAALSTAFGDLRMQLKEAYALGAITGPDMQVLEGVLTDPTGALGMTKGIISGNKAFEAQIEQSRAALNRQKRNFEQQYNLTLPEPAGTATAPMPGIDVPKFDAAKEARYQEWLRSQNK